MTRQVVVTAMAIWSPFGQGLDRFWNGLIGKIEGRRPISRLNVDHWVYRSRTAADVTDIGSDFDGKAEIAATEIMHKVADDILEQANPENMETDRSNVGLCIGASQSATNIQFQSFIRLKRGEVGLGALGSSDSWVSSASLLRELAPKLGVGGPAAMVSTACTSSTSSVGTAFEWIRDGRASHVFAGGLGYFSQVSLTGFNILRLIGRQGCRPFDQARDGMMLGDGFALLLLEEEQAARRRGAVIHARIVGYSSANEAYHPTSPDPSGESAERVMWGALGRSYENLSALDYINAHGTGTIANDSAELTAIGRLLSRRTPSYGPVAVSSTKGAHGHCLGGAGSVELIATILAMRSMTIPPTIGLQNPENVPASLRLPLTPEAKSIRIALSNSFAFGGNVASIAIEAVGERQAMAH